MRSAFSTISLFGITVMMLVTMSVPMRAQIIDWVPRIPLLQTGWQTPGALEVYEDSTRNRLMTVGWRLGSVFRSVDNGETWQGVYSLGTDVVGKQGQIYVAPDGRYLWYGLTPWNQRVALKSSDGGETWRLFTQDTMVLKDGSYRGLERVIPPTNIRAFDSSRTGGFVVSSDLGETWRRVARPPSDTLGTYYPEDEPQAGPNILYYTGKPYLYRFDASKDTVWAETRVDHRATFIVEVDAGVVSKLGNGFRIYASYADSSHIDVTRWRNDDTNEEIELTIDHVLRMDDSTAYAIDSRGWIFEVRPRSRHIRCISPFGKAFQVNDGVKHDKPQLIFASTHRNKCIVVHGYSQQAHDSTRVWRVAELIDGAVARVDTVLSRRADLIVNGRFPLTYLGEQGLFMFTMSPLGFREVVRTTNLGETWSHIARVSSDELDPSFIGVRSTIRDPDGTLLAHTTQDHCVTPREVGALEYTQRLTGQNALFRTEPGTLFANTATLHRDGNRVLRAGRVLTTYDYKRGRATDTILPRGATMYRRLTPTMTAAGADSLWVSFNDGLEWAHVSAALVSPVASPRGQFSDVCRTSNGTLLTAIRGVDYFDVDERRGMVCYGGIARSTDDGDRWQWVETLPDSMRFVTRLVSVNDSTIVAVAGRMLIDSAQFKSDGSFRAEVAASALLLSTNDGRTWSITQRDARIGMARGDTEPDILDLGNGVVLASLFSGSAYISTTSGRSWNILELPDLGLGSVYSFRREENGDIMIATSVGAGYLRLPGITFATEQEHKPALSLRIHQHRVEITADKASSVRIIGIDGRVVEQHDAVAGMHTIDLSSLLRGTYGIEVIQTTGVVERRVFIR